MPAPEADPPPDYCTERTAMVPKRCRTRAKDHAYRVATERRQARQEIRRERKAAYFGPAPPANSDDEPPPF
jgi:hypothetical protein